MTSRTRTRVEPFTYIQGSTSETFEFANLVEYMKEDNFPGPTNVHHYKTYPRGGGTAYYNAATGHEGGDTVVNYALPMDLILPEINSRLFQFYLQLDSSNLATNTGINILQTIAEFTETLELFTKNFWLSTIGTNGLNSRAGRRHVVGSYGAFNWAVLPFIGELRGLLTLLVNLEQLLAEGAYESSNTINIAPISIPMADGQSLFVHNIEAVVRHTGKVQYGDLGASVWLDALGYYPDLATVWDLVPLSFMVNWLIPVGSFLESFRQPWITHIPFQGWATSKVTFDCELRIAGSPHYLDGVWYTAKGHQFHRSFRSEVLEVPPRQNVNADLPSLIEGFNILYLFHGQLLRGLTGDDDNRPYSLRPRHGDFRDLRLRSPRSPARISRRLV